MKRCDKRPIVENSNFPAIFPLSDATQLTNYPALSMSLLADNTAEIGLRLVAGARFFFD